ncbi:hypothetical protein PM082_013718 [Marasmius tenuissimus]|nr:hypothetical protein PM082_013718 [Marasmius tenuissimus]
MISQIMFFPIVERPQTFEDSLNAASEHHILPSKHAGISSGTRALGRTDTLLGKAMDNMPHLAYTQEEEMKDNCRRIHTDNHIPCLHITTINLYIFWSSLE